MIAIQEEKGSECRVEFERVLVGYQVTNTLNIKVRDLDNMGNIIDGATEAAGNLVRINRVSFAIEDTKSLQIEAIAGAGRPNPKRGFHGSNMVIRHQAIPTRSLSQQAA
jgi:hypothetical protein